MSYTALYRKWRPESFTEVKGQDHIVTTLQNQIKANRIGHAYLFCGTRGTGKTTVAKIFAKAVNCKDPQEGGPCGECDMCRAISSGVSMNVIEIDAASNNGVDNIREIREEVQYSPAEGKYKVYIIDEVHMLSIGAFNALLKTLEEPPSYVIFILATTEAHKIPVTILSRCQRYDFKRISIDTIAGRLSELMKEEGIRAEEKAIRYISRTADGSMRDALSLLDQCIAFYLGKDLQYENVLEVLGTVDTAVHGRMLRKVLSADTAGCIYMLEEMIMQGRDIGQFVVDFIWYLRNLLLIRTSNHIEDVIDISKDNRKLLEEESKLVDDNTLMRYIRIFSELSNSIKYAAQKRILVEVALIKLTKPAMEQSHEITDVLSRLAILEQQMEEGITVKNERPREASMPDQFQKTQEAVPQKRVLEALPEDLQTAAKQWNNIIQEVEDKVAYNFLKTSHVTVSKDGGGLEIMVNSPAGYSFINREEQIETIEKIIADKTERQIKIKVILLKENEDFHNMFTDIRDLVKMDIEIDDDKEDLI